MGNHKNDVIQIENREWLDSLQWVIDHEGSKRTEELIDLLLNTAEEQGVSTPEGKLIGRYVNSITPEEEAEYPGDLEREKEIYRAIRWNAMAIVVRANKKVEGIGGHISTFSSESTLFEVGFNHFFKGYDQGKPDIVYLQGHASPGIYARSFVERRIDEKVLEGFRFSISEGDNGLPSYPHPRIMPEYWRFPTVSMGLSPIQAIYQARFMKYMENRGLKEKNGQNVWAFLGDGEMDEPESTGALAVAAREQLDNLIFVVNCNLQRLDGPVRGNHKIVPELEGIFKGAGWKVIKVLWNEAWEKLFEKDKDGALIDYLESIPDGEIQRWVQLAPDEFRSNIAESQPDLKGLVNELSDEDIQNLGRGGHDPVKVYNAYKKAVEFKDGPVVVLAQTVKGHAQGKAGEASNVTHKKKKFDKEELLAFADELGMELDEKDLEKNIPFIRFEEDSDTFQYLKKRREALEGWLPERKVLAETWKQPGAKVFKSFKEGSGDKEVTTTSAFVQMLAKLISDKNCGDAIVPIIPDESRTFGMDALFSKAGIYAPRGQQYEPVDKGSLLYYNEEKTGVIIEEGITEAGSLSTFIAAGTYHVVNDRYMVPFFIFYSMFGFQRVGDLLWAAADARAKGFLIGGISGRTSLSGEGLQHTDGQSHLYALAYPNIKAYDPAFAYEMAVIVQQGMKEMYDEGHDFIYYITLTNQAYAMPSIPKGVTEKDIMSGMYAFRKSKKRKNKDKTVNLMGSGAIMSEVLQAADTLEKEHDLPVNIWSVTSYKSLYDNAIEVENKSNDKSSSEKNHIQKTLDKNGDLFIAASDYVNALPMAIARWIPGRYITLGTDGFGRSDTIPAMRKHFGVDADHIVQSALKAIGKSKHNGRKNSKTRKRKK